MSITARPGESFTAILTGAPQGLVGTLTLGIRELPSETVTSAQATTGITATNLGDSTANYSGVRTAPTDTTKLYEVVWLNGSVETTEDLHVSGTVPAASLVPDLADVGALLRARTVDDNGNELGTFTSATRPTNTEVLSLIDDAVRDVRRHVGPALDTTEDDNLLASAKKLAAIRAAMLVELSYFPEQVADDQSPYGRYKEMWDEGIASLAASLTSDPGDVQGVGSIIVASPTNSAHMDQLAGVDVWTP